MKTENMLQNSFINFQTNKMKIKNLYFYRIHFSIFQKKILFEGLIDGRATPGFPQVIKQDGGNRESLDKKTVREVVENGHRTFEEISDSFGNWSFQ